MNANSTPEEVRREASLINRIVAFALEQPLLVVLLSLALAGAGVWAYQVLPMDAYPDLSPPYVEIISQWPGHSAEEVERLITVPIERGHERHPGARDQALDLALWAVGRHSHVRQRRQTLFRAPASLQPPSGHYSA